MKDYIQLLKKIWRLNRVHVSDDMTQALEETKKLYTGSQILGYKSGTKVGGAASWEIPPKWVVTKAELRSVDGDIICSIEENPLRLYSYSPSFQGEVSRDELLKHIMTNPNRPKSIPFHFRNQYRPWEREWGFCLRYEEYERLNESSYYVDISTEFIAAEMHQLEYQKKGKSTKRFMLLSHFDHPAMVMDGLAGCIIVNEIIRRLQDIDTYYSYVALNTVEIIGSVAYCELEKEKIENTCEAIFMGMPAPNQNLSYQLSSDPENSIIDRIMCNLLSFREKEIKKYPYRGLVGNDENAFESPGVNIRCGSLLRAPFPEYHTEDDNFDLVDEDIFEEFIEIGLKLIDAIENNYIIQVEFQGLPCMSSPDIDLYLSPSNISGMKNSDEINGGLLKNLTKEEITYLEKETAKLNRFMSGLIAILSHDKEWDVLSISEYFELPFRFVLNYIDAMHEKNLIKLIRIED